MGMVNEARKLGLPLMNVVRFKGMPILEQLFLEEKLLLSSSENWCLFNDGTHPPSIVMGLSGKPSELLELGSVLQDEVPVLRRFTGGGTVFVDHGTIFFMLICNKDHVPGVQPYPRSIISWSGCLYSEVFKGISDFQLCENDYVFGDRKIGGNAQSIVKNRWIHHTSFLWDYEVENMAYSRAPKYRSARDHIEFICRMKEYLPRSVFIEKTIKALESHFIVQPMNFETIGGVNERGFVHTTSLLSGQWEKDI